MDVASFDEIAGEFDRRVRRIVWCSMATQDRQGRLRSRIIHPIWEGPRGWIATAKTLKAKHLAQNPWVSLSYWDPRHEQVYVDAKAEWEDDPATKQRIWDLYKDTPPPLGYDPALFFQSVDSPTYSVLKLTPWRIELWNIGDMAGGKPPLVWRQPVE